MITKEKLPWCFIKFSQLILKGNVWRSVWRIHMWILGLKGLKAIQYSVNMLKGDVSRNSAKLGNYKMPVKLGEREK